MVDFTATAQTFPLPLELGIPRDAGNASTPAYNEFMFCLL